MSVCLSTTTGVHKQACVWERTRACFTDLIHTRQRGGDIMLPHKAQLATEIIRGLGISVTPEGPKLCPDLPREAALLKGI